MALKFYISLIVNFTGSRSFTGYFLMLAKLNPSNLFSRKAKTSTHLAVASETVEIAVIEKVAADQINEFLSDKKLSVWIQK